MRHLLNTLYVMTQGAYLHLEGETLVDAAKRVHIDIPNLCYMRDLDIVSSCRLCVVEIEGWGGVSTACSTFVQEGMVVHTETDELIVMRRDLLQLLLDNHPKEQSLLILHRLQY